MKKFIIAMMSVLFLIVGCQVEVIENSSEDNSVDEFIAISESFDGNTKTTLGKDNNILWSQGDQLAIFQGCNIADKYQVTDATAGTGQGVFSIVSDESGSINGDFSAGMEIATNIAFYPYMESLSCSKNNVNNSTSEVTSYNIDNIILPEVQYYAENSFCNGSFPMVAVTEGLKDHTLKFKNVLGAMKLQLKGSQIVKSIKITGKNNEKLSGAATVTAYPNGANPALIMSDISNSYVTLDCGNGVQLNKYSATSFFITLPPTLFSNGFTITITNTEDNIIEFAANTVNMVVRSSILVMPEVNLDNALDNPEKDDDAIYAEYIYLDKNYLEIPIGVSYTLRPSLDPIDVTYPTLTWTSSDSTVAEVDQNGKITAKGDGYAEISVLAVGGATAMCSVYVETPTGVAYRDYIDEYGVNHGKGIVIGRLVWAPVNCGYKAETETEKGYPYGKLYQWGRKYGQGYDDRDLSYPTGANLINNQVELSFGSSNDYKDAFFYGFDNWSNRDVEDLWEDGTGNRTKKDPCPEGWRVPTYSEIGNLTRYHSSWTTKDGQNGYYFTGPYTYISELPMVFLPAAGQRSYYDGNSSARNSEGNYWIAIPRDDRGRARYLKFDDYRDVWFDMYVSKANGCSIRCIQE